MPTRRDVQEQRENPDQTSLMTAQELEPIAARIGVLIEREDGGSTAGAARRLGVPAFELDRLLAGGAVDSVAELLARVVSAYGVEICWLVTGEREFSLARLPPATRAEVVGLLRDVADLLLTEFAHRSSSRAADQ